jgi:hypothetical protein
MGGIQPALRHHALGSEVDYDSWLHPIN